MAEAGISLGERAPEFRLPDTDGNPHELGAPRAAPATVLVWTCNHCPYALAWHDRIHEVATDYAEAGVRTLMVNSNDAERYPVDGPEAMRERVEKEGWKVPYLYDADQSVARAYGARTTPDLFVLDADLRLLYRGAPDGDHGNPAENAVWLREALDAALAGARPARPETEPVGCSIKWRD